MHSTTSYWIFTQVCIGWSRKNTVKNSWKSGRYDMIESFLLSLANSLTCIKHSKRQMFSSCLRLQHFGKLWLNPKIMSNKNEYKTIQRLKTLTFQTYSGYCIENFIYFLFSRQRNKKNKYKHVLNALSFRALPYWLKLRNLNQYQKGICVFIVWWNDISVRHDSISKL